MLSAIHFDSVYPDPMPVVGRGLNVSGATSPSVQSEGNYEKRLDLKKWKTYC